MSEARHTPGPWRVEPIQEKRALRHNWKQIVGANHRDVVAVSGVTIRRDDEDDWDAGLIVGDADAKLIAAAPAMADALEAARMVLEVVSGMARHDSSATLTKIDAALRAAGRIP